METTTIIYHSHNGTPYAEQEVVNFTPSVGSTIDNPDYKSNSDTGLFVITDVQYEKINQKYTATVYAHSVDHDIVTKALEELHDFFTT